MIQKVREGRLLPWILLLCLRRNTTICSLLWKKLSMMSIRCWMTPFFPIALFPRVIVILRSRSFFLAMSHRWCTFVRKWCGVLSITCHVSYCLWLLRSRIKESITTSLGAISFWSLWTGRWLGVVLNLIHLFNNGYLLLSRAKLLLLSALSGNCTCSVVIWERRPSWYFIDALAVLRNHCLVSEEDLGISLRRSLKAIRLSQSSEVLYVGNNFLHVAVGALTAIFPLLELVVDHGLVLRSVIGGFIAMASMSDSHVCCGSGSLVSTRSIDRGLWVLRRLRNNSLRVIPLVRM